MKNVIFLLLTPLIFGQTPDQGLSGESFRAWLKAHFYDGRHRALTYQEAREAMFNFIDNQDGKVTGVYGGLVMDVPYGGSISSPNPMNTEHTIPQSFFSKNEPMRSDIHHLYPTFDKFNGNRANYPFDEIPDSVTNKWMIDQITRSTKPAANIDDYSEAVGRRFEPRESHKGNVARSIFYFYTMYPGYNIAAVGEINLLFAWHLADPVDEAERARNDAIESFQGSRNPYIDHPEWAVRAWEGIDEDEVNKVLAAMGKDPVTLGSTTTDAETGNEALVLALTELAEQWEQTILEQQRILMELRQTIDQLNKKN